MMAGRERAPPSDGVRAGPGVPGHRSAGRMSDGTGGGYGSTASQPWSCVFFRAPGPGATRCAERVGPRFPREAAQGGGCADFDDGDASVVRHPRESPRTVPTSRGR